MEHPSSSIQHSRKRLAAASAFGGAVVFAVFKLSAVAEAIHLGVVVYRLVGSVAPSLGAGGIWIGYVLFVIGAFAAWRFGRLSEDGDKNKAVVGSAVIVGAAGLLAAGVSTFDQPRPRAPVTVIHAEVKPKRHPVPTISAPGKHQRCR